MNQDDFKKLLDESLEPIKETLEDHTKRLEALAGDVKEIGEDVDALRGDVNTLQEDVKGVRDGIGLWHQRDKREIDEIKTHLGMPLMSDTPQV